MDTVTLLNDLLRPTYVMRMAGALVGRDPLRAVFPLASDPPRIRGAFTRYRNAHREVERLLATWAATRPPGHGYDGVREVHPGYPGDPATCLYGALGWTWINDGQNLVCPVCGLDGT